MLVILLALFSCEKEQFLDDPRARLAFSTDTVLFDTVFTTIGSTTKRFTVKNPHDQKVNISSIELAGGQASDYRLNINGRSTHRVNDVELDARDSLFIFVEVTVDPTHRNQPMVIKDSVIFRRKKQQQDVKLISWGQDVHLIRGDTLQSQTWDGDKPYLIYRSAVVDSQSTLTLEAGTRVYLHRQAGFYVGGRLICEGSKQRPVIFQGDRLEKDYADIPGQWDGIWLMSGSRNHRIDHTIIKNAITGLQVGSTPEVSGPILRLSNTRIMHMSHAGLLARGASIEAFNTLISDCGNYTAALTRGGSYAFYHSTLANYWSGTSRTTPSLIINNHYQDSTGATRLNQLEKALFSNCIIWGNQQEEIEINLKNQQKEGHLFTHCLIRTTRPADLDEAHYQDILVNEDPQFVSVSEHNYRLDTLSPAIDQGEMSVALEYPLDILNHSRTADMAPDLGAFEYIPGTDSTRQTSPIK